MFFNSVTHKMPVPGRIIYLLVTCVLFSGTSAFGQYYPVSDIPVKLVNDALVVVRNFSEEYDLQSVNSGVCKIHKVLTILTKEGEDLASLEVAYDKDSRVKVNQVTLYDKSGKKIRNVKQSEINDAPAFSSFELYSEDHLISYEPLFSDYPYTIEYNYEVTHDNLISYGIWAPQDDYGVSVEKATLIINYPPELRVNRKEISVVPARQENVKGHNVETWNLNDLPAIASEPFSVSILDRIPSVYLMPDVILYDKYYGRSDDWKNFGKWVYTLYSGKNKLPDEATQKISKMVMNISDTIARIRILYDFLQKNSRYVAITMGIGGYQPFDAETVWRTGYGDCKALSNYMASLLNVIGVRSYPALVAAGRYVMDIFPDFPNFRQFNHVILCVPSGRDTIWLECTDQNMPFGYLGDFADQRKVLLITPEGGVFAKTPEYKAQSNLMSGRSDFNINSSGKAEGTIKHKFTGLQYDDLAGIYNMNTDELKKWYYSRTSLPSLQIKSISLKNLRENNPVAELRLDFTSDNYASLSGKYLVLPLNRLNFQRPVQKMLKPRQSEIVIPRSYIDSDTIVFNIPAGFRPESIPSSIRLDSPFGNFTSSVTSSGDRLIFSRYFEIFQGKYNPEMYGKLYDFILAVSKADNGKILLLK